MSVDLDAIRARHVHGIWGSCDYCHEDWPCDAKQLLDVIDAARATHVEAAITENRTITTVEELDALPHGAVIGGRFRTGRIVLEKWGKKWVTPGLTSSIDDWKIQLPVRVLWLPDDEEVQA